MHQEHPFAPYVRILGKGRQGSRSLNEGEAYAAMRMILEEQIDPAQLGAFLMLMRVKEETPEELAGFVRASRESLNIPSYMPEVELDWSSYAGKRRHLPWFILAALLLAENGTRVFMHGTSGHTEGRLYTQEVLEMLGIPVSTTFAQVAVQLREQNFAFMPLVNLCPKLQEIMDLRSLFGLRSPIHTIVRLLNPLKATSLVQGIFHPNYAKLHQEAGLILQESHLAVFKGEGGESERNPEMSCVVKTVHEGTRDEESWPALFERPRPVRDESFNSKQLVEVWEKQVDNPYAVAAITGTVAIVLKLLDKELSTAEAESKAQVMWESRRQGRFFPIR